MEATWPERWEHLILASDYVFAIFDGLNRYYVRTEDSELLPALKSPVSPRDDYVPFHYHWTIEHIKAQLGHSQGLNDELSTRLSAYEDLGPNAIDVARRLHCVAAKYPKLSRTVKRIARLGA